MHAILTTSLGNIYNIYEQTNDHTICMYTHVLAWIKFYQLFILHREFTGDDYLFPSMAPKGSAFYSNEIISSDWVQQKLDSFADFLGISKAYRFTTHCFRRGGAQYRFMFAPPGQRWTLARIRWWGGWADGEHVSIFV